MGNQRRSPPRNSTATIVAQQAGVSVTTVSFVLNGHAKRHGIAEETAALVLEVARQLRYVPNGLARSLRKQSTKAIGVVFPHLRNDWAHNIMDGVCEVLDAEGYTPLIVNHRGDPQREVNELLSLIERRVDGILCNPLSHSLQQYRRIIDRGIPLVFFGDTLNELPEVGFAVWHPDEVMIAVQPLIEAGCRRIAYLGIDDTRRMAAERLAVFVGALSAAALPVNPRLLVQSDSNATLTPRLDALFEELFALSAPPDGVFALYDDIAMQLVRYLRSTRFRVPQDVKITTLGNAALLHEDAYGITSVSAPVRCEGAAAANALLRLISGKEAGEAQVMVTGGQLLRRRSTEIFV